MAASEIGAQDLFRKPDVPVQGETAQTVAREPSIDNGQKKPASAAGGITVHETSYASGWGKGPQSFDPRKFMYDRARTTVTGVTVNFSASKVDRMDAEEAGGVLHHLHQVLGIAAESEERLEAFDNALFLQHYLNGASMLQPGRGVLTVDGQQFDIGTTLTLIGEDRLRRFFRAYADEVAATIRKILDTFDPYDFASRDKVGQIQQVAALRGMSKFPEYAADSADACLELNPDVRRAINASKAMVLPKDDQTVKFASQMLKADMEV